MVLVDVEFGRVPRDSGLVIERRSGEIWVKVAMCIVSWGKLVRDIVGSAPSSVGC